ncbi:glycosyltransferase family 4 protein [Siphonobacter aquaeclarae]|uniref:Glycosyltransferase involved in cell wall bisynthesis n=1 Tax=Siphonobacter aquaeclarae TaxID=563176 RepID=A0A1G9NCL0_9BACT|nr:Glycosyltransferase involved in cell wall bisynthesis [Siphonobacter aquaeclarae]
MVKTLADELFERGYEVTVYYFDDLKGINFKCPTKRISYLSSEPFRNNDIIHSHSFRPDIYNLVRGVFFRKPKISTAHCYVYQDFAMFYGKIVSVVFGSLWIQIWRRFRMVVQLTDDMEKYYRSYLRSDRMCVIHNAKFVDRFEPEITETEKAVLDGWSARNLSVLGISAKLIPRKGIDQVIRALPSLPGFAALVLGDGQEAENLRDLARLGGVEDRVLWGGFRENSYRFLKYVDISVLPSFSEGFPLALLEAIYFEKPIVCSGIPTHRSIFTEEEVGFFELGDIQDLVRAIEKTYARRKVIRARMKELSIKYSLDAMTESYLKLYRACL